MEQHGGRLTPHQIEIVRMIAAGLDTAAIANRLHRSPRTIEVTRRRIAEKLGTNRVALITRWAIREGLVEP